MIRGARVSQVKAQEGGRSSTGMLMRMAASGSGPIVGMAILMAIPFIARSFLTDNDFAMWVLAATVAAAGLTMDFGGYTYLMATLPGASNPRQIITRALIASTAGSLLVAALSMLVWLLFERGNPLSGWNFLPGCALLFATGVGSVARSAAYICGAIELVANRHRQRGTVLITLALAQVMLILIALSIWKSPWVLPFSMSASSLIVLLAYLRRVHRHGLGLLQDERRPRGREVSLRDFAVGRSAATILTVLIGQGDRWLVGALGGPGALVGYELAARFATLPKQAIVALVPIVLPDTARLKHDPEQLDVYVAQTARIFLWLTVLFSIGAAIAAWYLLPIFASTGSIENLRLVTVILLVGHGAHALTAAGTTATLGIGEPRRENAYLTLILFCIVIGSAALLLFGGGLNGLTWFSSVLAGSMILGSTYFLRSRPWAALPGHNLSALPRPFTRLVHGRD